MPLFRGGKQTAPPPPPFLHSDVWPLVYLRSQTLCSTVMQQVCLNSSCWSPGPAVPSLETIPGSLCTATSVLLWTRSLITSSNSGEFSLDGRFGLQTARAKVSAHWRLANQITVRYSFSICWYSCQCTSISHRLISYPTFSVCFSPL